MPSEIIADARARVGTETASFEATIEKLEQARQALERDREAEQQKLREAEENRKESAKLRIELELRLEKAELKARRDAERIIAEARETAERAFSEIDEMRSRMNDEEDHRSANEARAELRRRLNAAEEKFAERPAMPAEHRGPTRPAAAGDTVEILSMGVKATVTEVTRDGTLSLQAGNMHLFARQDEVRVTEAAKPKKTAAPSAGAAGGFRAESTASELDLRGMDTLEAVTVLERFIDAAAIRISIAHHPRERHRRAAPGGAVRAQTQPLRQELPPGALRRGRDRRHCGGTEINAPFRRRGHC